MKPNLKPYQRKNQRPNYFQQNIQKFGENFLGQKNSNDMQLDAIRVFRDIARGNIDVEEEGKYFLHPQFLESCIVAAFSKLSLHSINFNGVNLLVSQGANDETTMSILEYDRRCAEAYTIIYNQLNNIRNTGDVNYLTVMVNNLKNYRNNI